MLIRTPRRLLEREAYLVLLASLYAFVLVIMLPYEFVQDSWLTLVGGREIWTNGLPTHDTLTVMSNGVDWVEQQWAAKLAFFGLYGIGGLRLVTFAHVFALTAAFVGAAAFARRGGASATSVFWVGVAGMLVAPWAWQLRSQTFAFPLFVALVTILVGDSRAPSRRVFLVFPILLLWANVHGSVLLGVGLVVARALSRPFDHRGVEAPSTRRWRAAALLCAPACALVSPYGWSLVGYYESLVLNDDIARFVIEWQPSTFPNDWPFFVLATAAVWTAARARTLVPFEKISLLLVIAAGLAASRNAVWMSLFALTVIPRAVDEVWGARRLEPLHHGRITVGMAGVAAAAAVAAGLSLLVTQPTVAARYPDRLPAVVAAAASCDPSVRLLASDAYADWLLWKEPQLAGRLAYDVRFELFTRTQFERLSAFRAKRGADWKSFAHGYALLVLDRKVDRKIEDALLAETGARTVYRDANVTVVWRGANAGAARAPRVPRIRSGGAATSAPLSQACRAFGRA